jgi:chloramphenicol-sensitive protein RarD
MGLLQYLTPTIQFVIGVTVRHEPLGAVRLIGFVLVWLALIVFTIDSASGRRRRYVPLPPTTATPLLAPEPVARCR